MAILNKIRQRSLFLILVIAMALFSFVLADLFKGGGGSSVQDTIATVNGEDINRVEFMNKVESTQRQFGGSMTGTQAMNRVWNQELNNVIMNEQFEELGITIEREKMRELIKLGLQSFEEFKNADGIYDENKLNEFIANLKAISPETAMLNGSPINYDAWTDYENNIAVGGKRDMYFNMIKAGVTATLAEGELDYKLENDKVDLKFVKIPYSTIADSTINVSKSEIEAYINKNKSKYEVEASRDIYFVQFKEEASLEDEKEIQNTLVKLLEGVKDNETTTAVDETEIGFRDTTDDEGFLAANSAIKLLDMYSFKNALPAVAADSIFNLEKGGVYGPYKDGNMFKITKVIDVKQQHDSIKTRHILIPHVGAMRVDPSVTQTEEQAKKTADSLLAALRRDKSKFGDFVTNFSSDLGSKSNGGEYDFHPEGQMVKPFSDFEATSRIGELGVVKTDFGFHIIEVLDRKSAKKAVKVGHLALEIEPSDATVDKVFNEVSKFEIAVADKDYNEVAKEKNYTVMPVSDIKELDETIPGLGNQRSIVRWAFEKDTKVGDVKRFNLSNGYAVVMLTAENKKGLMTAEKASVTALPEIRKKKKAKMIIDGISGTTVEDIAKNSNQSVQTSLAVNLKNPTLSGAGREPKVIGTAFGLKEGETSKPIAGNFAVFVMQVTKATSADALPNYQAAANRLSATKTGAVNTQVLNALKAAADIEDNRATFY